MAFDKYDPQSPEHFAQNARLFIDFIQKKTGIILRYDMESVWKLDGIVKAVRTPKNLEKWVLSMGSFLGEAFRHLYGGRWEWSDHWKTWGVTFPLGQDGEDAAHVFAKVQKRFVDGEGDSISFMGEVVDQRVKGIIP